MRPLWLFFFPGLLWLLAIAQKPWLMAQSEHVTPIRIEVGAGKALTVTIPNVAKHDVVAIISSMFGRDDAAAKARFTAVFGDASTIRLVLESSSK